MAFAVAPLGSGCRSGRLPKSRVLCVSSRAHQVSVRFSINIPNFGDFADPATVAKVAAAAEQARWDALFVWDHVVPTRTSVEASSSATRGCC
ncbi:hypothetical protein [Saccharopolyspora elongata]|uniref:hypothetical protein n=1 Tax=Saccharopolyspora elongata TaxID=2530387 RepID=UPI001A9FD996|nr:hypothetical protein [Saccharopolyspora elongata]